MPNIINQRESFKPFIGLTLLLLVAFLINVKLFSSVEIIRFKKNGFNRAFLNAPEQYKNIKLRYSEYTKIAGFIGDKLILTSNQKQSYLELNPIGGNQEEYDLPLLKRFGKNYRTSEVKDSFLYFFCDAAHLIMKHDILSEQSIMYFVNSRYSRASILSDDNLLIRNLDRNRESQSFKVVNLTNNGVVISQKSNILRLNDGGLSGDGLLKRDDNKMYFMCFFLNKVYIVDSALALNKYINLIDTNTVCKNRIERILNSKTFTFTGALSQVNVNFSTSNDLLAVQSPLIADNQNKKSFNNKMFFDFYSLKRNVYLGTLSVDKNGSGNLIDFLIKGSAIYCLFKNKLIIYNLNNIY